MNRDEVTDDADRPGPDTEVWVDFPDPGVDRWCPPPGQPRHRGPGGGRATVEDDDTTIHFPAFGGALTEFHHAEFVEYDTCVVGRAVTTERATPPGTVIPAVGVGAHVTGHLVAPLGGRVLLNSTGDPVAVQRTSETRPR